MELAELIKDSLGSKIGADIELLPNPRIEQDHITILLIRLLLNWAFRQIS